MLIQHFNIWLSLLKFMILIILIAKISQAPLTSQFQIRELRHSETNQGFPGGSDSKESGYKVGDLGSVPGSGRYPGEGNGYPLQYSCLENSMARGAWWATIQFSSVGQSCLTLCDPMDCSTPGFPAHHQLREFTQTHVH